MVETLVGNWSDNSALIRSQIGNVEKYMGLGDYEQAGKDLAAMLETGLGFGKPDDNEQLLALADSSIGAPEIELLVGNFLKELVYINHLDSLSGCAIDTKSLVTDIQEIWSLYQ